MPRTRQAHFLLAPACASFLLVACNGDGRASERTDTMTAQSSPHSQAQVAERIARLAGFDLPASAKVVFADYTQGHDDSARLLIDLPEADWLAMKAKPPLAAIDQRAWSPDNVFHLGPAEGPWQPGQAAGLEVAQTPVAEGRQSLNVGVAPAQGGKVRVYLHWFQL
jgi:hypothetical protein